MKIIYENLNYTGTTYESEFCSPYAKLMGKINKKKIKFNDDEQ